MPLGTDSSQELPKSCRGQGLLGIVVHWGQELRHAAPGVGPMSGRPASVGGRNLRLTTGPQVRLKWAKTLALLWPLPNSGWGLGTAIHSAHSAVRESDHSGLLGITPSRTSPRLEWNFPPKEEG